MDYCVFRRQANVHPFFSNSGLFFNVRLLEGLLQQVSGDAVSIHNRLFNSKHLKMNIMQESSKTTVALREVVTLELHKRISR